MEISIDWIKVKLISRNVISTYLIPTLLASSLFCKGKLRERERKEE